MRGSLLELILVFHPAVPLDLADVVEEEGFDPMLTDEAVIFSSICSSVRRRQSMSMYPDEVLIGRPTVNMDKDTDHVFVVFQAKPIIAGMEPAENSDDYPIWDDAMNRVTGKATSSCRSRAKASFPAARK